MLAKMTAQPMKLLLMVHLLAGITALSLPAQAQQSQEQSVEVTPVELLTAEELQELVAPVALYPDDLLAIVLPAATYPVQVVAAARYRAGNTNSANTEPNEDWDESIVALLNYPEALDLLNDDIDWTWQLGQAVLDQEADVLAAVQSFRTLARTAGNLESNDAVVVEEQLAQESGDTHIVIKPADPEVIYVPYYEPEVITVYQTRPVYHYYSTAYPLYYRPYYSSHRFYDHHHHSHFWGLSSIFALSWGHSWGHHHINHYYHGHRKHRYYGRSYPRRHFSRTQRYHHRHAHDRRYNRRYRDGHREYRHGGRWRPQHSYAGARPGPSNRQRYRDNRGTRQGRWNRAEREPHVVHRRPDRQVSAIHRQVDGTVRTGRQNRALDAPQRRVGARAVQENREARRIRRNAEATQRQPSTRNSAAVTRNSFNQSQRSSAGQRIPRQSQPRNLNNREQRAANRATQSSQRRAERNPQQRQQIRRQLNKDSVTRNSTVRPNRQFNSRSSATNTRPARVTQAPRQVQQRQVQQRQVRPQQRAQVQSRPQQRVQQRPQRTENRAKTYNSRQSQRVERRSAPQQSHRARQNQRSDSGRQNRGNNQRHGGRQQIR